jgi:PleD family two-component response regulator
MWYNENASILDKLGQESWSGRPFSGFSSVRLGRRGETRRRVSSERTRDQTSQGEKAGVEQKGSILVIDHELGMRVGCQRALQSQGYHVDTAPNGMEGLEKLRAKRIHRWVLAWGFPSSNASWRPMKDRSAYSLK